MRAGEAAVTIFARAKIRASRIWGFRGGPQVALPAAVAKGYFGGGGQRRKDAKNYFDCLWLSLLNQMLTE